MSTLETAASLLAVIIYCTDCIWLTGQLGLDVYVLPVLAGSDVIPPAAQ